jgi:hypothetical protein
MCVRRVASGVTGGPSGSGELSSVTARRERDICRPFEWPAQLGRKNRGPPAGRRRWPRGPATGSRRVYGGDGWACPSAVAGLKGPGDARRAGESVPGCFGGVGPPRYPPGWAPGSAVSDWAKGDWARAKGQATHPNTVSIGKPGQPEQHLAEFWPVSRRDGGGRLLSKVGQGQDVQLTAKLDPGGERPLPVRPAPPDDGLAPDCPSLARRP